MPLVPRPGLLWKIIIGWNRCSVLVKYRIKFYEHFSIWQRRHTLQSTSFVFHTLVIMTRKFPFLLLDFVGQSVYIWCAHNIIFGSMFLFSAGVKLKCGSGYGRKDNLTYISRVIKCLSFQWTQRTNPKCDVKKQLNRSLFWNTLTYNPIYRLFQFNASFAKFSNGFVVI